MSKVLYSMGEMVLEKVVLPVHFENSQENQFQLYIQHR